MRGKKIRGTNQYGMSRSEINRMLVQVDSWNAADSEACTAFAEAMRVRRYGYDALLDAWAWFHYGWLAQAAAVGARG